MDFLLILTPTIRNHLLLVEEGTVRMPLTARNTEGDVQWIPVSGKVSPVQTFERGRDPLDTPGSFCIVSEWLNANICRVGGGGDGCALEAPSTLHTSDDSMKKICAGTNSMCNHELWNTVCGHVDMITLMLNVWWAVDGAGRKSATASVQEFVL